MWGLFKAYLVLVHARLAHGTVFNLPGDLHPPAKGKETAVASWNKFDIHVQKAALDTARWSAFDLNAGA